MDLEERRKGIGGSDVGAILGYSSIPGSCVYKTPAEIWHEKINGPPQAIEVTPTNKRYAPLWWGREMEPLLIKAYKQVESAKVKEGSSVGQVSHPDYPWLIANVDGIAEVDGKKLILEVKNVDHDFNNSWGEPGTDQVPLGYYMQVQHYMLVLDLDEARIAARVGGVLKVYHIHRDDELIEDTLEDLSEFWHENVLKKVPPRAKTLSDVRLSYKAEEGASMKASQEQFEMISTAKMAAKRLEKAKRDLEEIKARLAQDMGENTVLVNDSDEKLVTFKPRKDGVRVFKIN